MNYILGIDQGGTKTAAVIGDFEGHILGIGKSFGAIHSVHGMPRAMEAMKAACDAALKQAGAEYGDIYGIYGGISGLDWDYEYELLVSAMHRVIPVERIYAVNDCIIALRSASSAENSAVICAGTGVNCAVRNKNRQIIFGYYIPDSLQGGSAIGQQALQAVFDAQAGVGEPTLLTQKLLGFYALPDVDSLLMRYINKEIPPDSISRLSRLAEEAALEGDGPADRLFESFAKGIVPYIHSGMKKLGIAEEPVDVVLSGSIFKCRAKSLQDTVRFCLRDGFPGINIIDARYEPVIGAYLLGLDQVPEADFTRVWENIESEQNKFHISRRRHA